LNVRALPVRTVMVSSSFAAVYVAAAGAVVVYGELSVSIIPFDVVRDGIAK